MSQSTSETRDTDPILICYVLHKFSQNLTAVYQYFIEVLRTTSFLNYSYKQDDSTLYLYEAAYRVSDRKERKKERRREGRKEGREDERRRATHTKRERKTGHKNGF